MSLKSSLAENRSAGTIGAVVTTLVGAFLLIFPVGEGLVRLSYDLPFLFQPEIQTDEVVIIKMDEQSHRKLNQPFGENWDRLLHARLLNKLKSDGARLVVFDVFFAKAGPEEADQALAAAITNHGNVVLTADREPISQPGIEGEQTLPPPAVFLSVIGKRWGISKVVKDGDACVRIHYAGAPDDPSLAWAAAEAYGGAVTKKTEQRFLPRWINYYGSYESIPSLSYYLALEKPAGFFRGQIVFIGGKPLTVHVGGESDEYATPFTRWTERFTPGVEIQATMFMNLVRENWLRRMPGMRELFLVVLAGVVFGFGMSMAPPLKGFGWACLSSLILSAGAVFLFLTQRIWFDWILIAGVQVPVAWGCSAVLYSRTLLREKQVLERKIATVHLLKHVSATEIMAPPVRQTRTGFPIPDYNLLSFIGGGSFGEVWLAQNAIGTYHAVKIIKRAQFKDKESYEREFEGIQKYMPISHRHPGLVRFLHVGRNDEAGYYYCVMEAADDEVTGSRIDPESYSPRTLGKDLQKKGYFPVETCLRIALSLTSSLEFLHQQLLVHRDIKPSNIIFVDGVPKLADIGLVKGLIAEGNPATYVGTPGYIPPEGPGRPEADIYSLGKVIYQMATGLDRKAFPELPASLAERPDSSALIQLNAIYLKACENDPRQRYHSVAELHRDLLKLEADLQRVHTA